MDKLEFQGVKFEAKDVPKIFSEIIRLSGCELEILQAIHNVNV